MPLRFLQIVTLLCFAIMASAQSAHSDLTAIQDNSFLLEEAYNQDKGVVQHISVFQRDHDSGAWSFAFTQEWPAPALTHQLSATIPFLGDDGSGLGDVMLNYRYQLIGSADTNLAIAPRLSLILPTRDDRFGDGSAGVQVALPISRVYAPRIAGHTNIGATWYEDDGSEINLGQSFIYAPRANVQLMLEATWSRPDDGDATLLVSPGIRWAYNFSNGLQIVPGIAMPLGVGPSSGSNAVLLYLSFEHPF